MSKKIYLFSLVLLAFTFASCDETKEVGRYDNWQARGVAFIDSIANVYAGQQNGSITVTDEKERLHAILDESTKKTIYVKKISKTGTSIEKPKFTSVIKAYYRLSYFNGDVLQQTFKGTEPDEFDTPAKFALNSVISGWSYALAHMQVGEFWTLYIPQESAYGAGTNSEAGASLEPYSALVYQVKLDEIVEP